MRTLYIDASMGAAGDMLTGALLDLFEEPEKEIAKLNRLFAPIVNYTLERSAKCGITGSHAHVLVNGEEEGHHHHEGEHHHGQGLHGIIHRIEHLDLESHVREDAMNVFKSIAKAEGMVHGMPMDEIHFHEVGTWDAVADVVAVSYLLDQLHVDKVVCSPVHVGSGTVKCAHGILPVPAPATALLLEGIPMYSEDIKGELCTPTGAALLRYFVDEFGKMPMMISEKIGYGMGNKDFERANCVRMILGHDEEDKDDVIELSCNIDDMSAEDISYALTKCFENGAFEAYTIAVNMKKNRAGTLIKVMCSKSAKEGLVKTIFRYTSTIGIREMVIHRYTLERSIKTVENELGKVHYKISEGYGVKRIKAEFDDIKEIADKTGMTLEDVREKFKAD